MNGNENPIWSWKNSGKTELLCRELYKYTPKNFMRTSSICLGSKGVVLFYYFIFYF